MFCVVAWCFVAGFGWFSLGGCAGLIVLLGYYLLLVLFIINLLDLWVCFICLFIWLCFGCWVCCDCFVWICLRLGICCCRFYYVCGFAVLCFAFWFGALMLDLWLTFCLVTVSVYCFRCLIGLLLFDWIFVLLCLAIWVWVWLNFVRYCVWLFTVRLFIA